MYSTLVPELRHCQCRKSLISQLRLRWSNPARDLVCAFRTAVTVTSLYTIVLQSPPRACFYYSSLPSRREKKKKNLGNRLWSIPKRRDLASHPIKKKCVIKNTHLPFTYSLFSDEQGWKELQVPDQISRDESPGSSISTLNSLLNFSEPPL